MKFETELIEKFSWETCREQFHKDIFGDDFKDQNREYDFTLVVKLDGVNVSYTQVKELDRDTAYMTFGGVFPEFRSKGIGYDNFQAMVDVLTAKYKMIGIATRTNNIGMIKLCFNSKFEIIGLRLINGLPSLEFLLERGK